MGDLIVLSILGVIVLLVSISIYKSKKTSTCSGGCAACHKNCSSDIYAQYKKEH